MQDEFDLAAVGQAGAELGQHQAAVRQEGALQEAWPVAAGRTGEDDKMKAEKRLFAYSIVYLFVLFGALAVDRLLIL